MKFSGYMRSLSLNGDRDRQSPHIYMNIYVSKTFASVSVLVSVTIIKNIQGNVILNIHVLYMYMYVATHKTSRKRL